MRIPIVATRKTAAISGFVLALGLSAYDRMAALLHIQSPYDSVFFFVVLAFLFFMPCVLFVMGTESLTAGWKDFTTSRYWQQLLQVLVRGLCWLFGAGTAWAILAAFGILAK